MKKLLLSLSLGFLLEHSVCQAVEQGFYTCPSFVDSVNDNLNAHLSTCYLQTGIAGGQFIGLKEAYAEIGASIAPDPLYDWYPIFDLRAYRLDDSHWASSLGFGIRRWNSSATEIWGVNLFRDSRDTHSGNFNRIGIGFELLTGCLDSRLNFYIPTSSSRAKTIFTRNFTKGIDYNKDFDSDTDLLVKRHLEKLSFLGVDFEVAQELWQFCEYDLALSGAAGPYYYHHKEVDSIFGAQGRLELTWRKYATFELRVSCDTEFGANAQAKLMVDLPLFELLCGRVDDYWTDQITQPIKRQGVIFTKDHKYWTKKNY